MNSTTDNNGGRFSVPEEHLNNFALIDRVKIAELSLEDNSDLLIFPDSLDEYGDKIEDDYVFELHQQKLTTGNIMGFVGVNGSELKIKSRFAKEDQEDYFLHYMLEKVFAINLFDLKHSSSSEDIFDFILFLFPHFLRKAYRQGLYKEYQHKKYNDASVRGRIDINRHIQKNMPFAGTIAYQIREYSYDNHITQLIRHTIEFIAEKGFGYQILNNDDDTSSIVAQIRRLTLSYEKKQRRRVLYENIKPFSHPYFTAYKDLQKLCKKILHQEGIKFGFSKDKIYGILFDGAWLWEEYLHIILKPLRLIHPDNKERTGRIYLFNNNRGHRYPDFYNEQMVLDAKYKRLIEHRVNRDDIHQIISYMYILQSKIGGFISPVESGIINNFETRIGELNGYGNEVFVWRLPVPEEVENYKEFKQRIVKNEVLLVERIRNEVYDKSAISKSSHHL